jgi:hypothetical protein
MTTATTATCAYDQIDQARTELNAVSKQTTYKSLEVAIKTRNKSASVTGWAGRLVGELDVRIGGHR